MSVPGQEYPPWFTFLPTTVTNADGSEQTTDVVAYLPLTYYGPSIPLGDGWTYGGSTSPASTDGPTATTPTTEAPTTSANEPTTTTTTTTETTTTTDLDTTTTTTAIPTTITSPFSSQSTSASSSSSSSSSSPTVVPSSGLHGAPLVGVIVGTLLGFAALCFLLLLCFLIVRRRRKERDDINHFKFMIPGQGAPSKGYTEKDSAALMGGRVPGQGSPRHSGEEEDPLLQRRSDPLPAQSTPWVPSGIRQVQSEPIPEGSQNSKNSKSTERSAGSTDYGSPLPDQRFQPVDHVNILDPIHRLPIPEEDEQPEENGPVYSMPEGMLSGANSDSDQFGFIRMLPPPQIFNGSPYSSLSSSSRSHSPFDAEEGETMVATHVRFLSPNASPVVTTRSPLASEEPLFPPMPVQQQENRHSWIDAGLGALARMFNSTPSPTTPASERNWPPSAWRSDNDMHRALLFDAGSSSSSDQYTTLPLSPRKRQRELGMRPSAERPTSWVSGKSQNSNGTTYYTPMSSLSEKSAVAYHSLGHSHSATGHSRATSAADSALALNNTAAVAVEQPPPAYTPSQQSDVLDMPAPAPAVPWLHPASSTATSSRGTMVSDTSTMVNHNSSLLDSPSAPSGSQAKPRERSMRDILEEEPPQAQDHWRTLAANGEGPTSIQGKRTTFGLPQYVQSQSDITSEQGSLHSTQSYAPMLTPSGYHSHSHSSRSRMMNGSGSSRGTRRTGSSSLAHASSLSSSSDGHIRRTYHGRASPAVSAVGPYIPSPHLGSFTHYEHQASSHSSGSKRGVRQQEISQESSYATSFLNASATNASRPRATSPSLLGEPWAGGLHDDWEPTV